MNRRTLLKTVAVGATAATWPGWIRRAFAKPPCPPDQREAIGAVAASYRRALRAGKPLLVFVVPAAWPERYSRGVRFGEYLNHARPGALAVLPLAEVVCASAAVLRAVVPQTPNVEPLMFLVDTDERPPSVHALNERAPTEAESRVETPPTDTQQPRYWERLQAAETAEIDGRIERMSELVASALAGGPEMLRRRVAQARTQGDNAVARRMEAILIRGLVPPDVNAGAAIVYAAMVHGSGAWALQLRQALEDDAIARWREHEVPGGRWTLQDGCGGSIDCGMGDVPEKSARFLFFLSQADQ